EHITAFLSSLANRSNVAGSTQNQALAAVLFLYREVLQVELPLLEGIVRARRPKRLPTVLSAAEARSILECMDGMHGLIARLMYGTGMRIMECLSLRVKDVDLERKQITVRHGKGGKDRITMVPGTLVDALRAQLEDSRGIYRIDRERGIP